VKHVSEEGLILARYDGDRAVTRHLAVCLSCRRQMAELERLLSAVEKAPVPERGESYGREVWRKIEDRLPERRERSWRLSIGAPRLAFAGALAAVALAAFLAGRLWRGPGEAPAPPARERILRAAVGDHLDRSQAVLLEILHSPIARGAADAEGERARVEELLAANRLYRLSAASSGERGVSDVLEDLERVLLEIAHAPTPGLPDEVRSSARRTEVEEVLFKIRVLGSRMRQREEVLDRRAERKRA
jgi:hypothetical protein